MSPSSRELESQTPEISVLHWPIRDEWLGGGITLGLFFILAVIAYWRTENLWLATLLAGVMLISVWRMLLPVRFDLGPRGIVQKSLLGTRKTSWREIHHYRMHGKGAILYPSTDEGMLANLSAIQISAPQTLAQLEEVIHYYLDVRRTVSGSSIVRHGSTSGSEI